MFGVVSLGVWWIMVGFFLLFDEPRGLGFPWATSRGKGIKLREGLSSRSEVGKTGQTAEGQFNVWREPDGEDLPLPIAVER
jgi:hypothetical protein